MKARVARLESVFVRTTPGVGGRPGTWRRLATLALLCAYAGGGTGSAQEAEDAPPPKTVDARELEPIAEDACLIVRQIRSFDALGDRYVFVEGRRSERYLLTMLPGCIGLRSAFGIALDSRGGSRVCTGSGADIRYRGLGGRTETCPIRRVEAVEDKASAERLVELRQR